MKLPMEQDRIEKQIELKAPLERIWRALTDYREFSQWFGVNLEGPFIPGQTARGRLTYPGYEHHIMEVVVQKMQPERLFSFTWHPYATRFTKRLLAGAVNLGRVPAGAKKRRHSAHGNRIGLQQNFRRPPARGISDER